MDPSVLFVVLRRVLVRSRWFGPCDWTAVFNGDQAQRDVLQRALDAESNRIERWASALT